MELADSISGQNNLGRIRIKGEFHAKKSYVHYIYCYISTGA